MQVIEITNANEVEYFRGVVKAGLAGDYGKVAKVTVIVDDNGRVSLGVNGYQSSPVGAVVRDGRTTTQVMDDLQANDVRPNHPYANIDAAEGEPEGDAPEPKGKKGKKSKRLDELEEGLADLERFADAVVRTGLLPHSVTSQFTFGDY